VIVQWCVKGLNLGSDAEAKSIIDSGEGLLSQWWRDAGGFQAYDVKHKLTPANIDMHVNQFHQRDPATGRPFYETTPFISLTAGTVERDTVLATNIVHSARRVALHFGSRFGAVPRPTCSTAGWSSVRGVPWWSRAWPRRSGT